MPLSVSSVSVFGQLNECNSIDATIVRASQYATGALTVQANEAIGRSRWGISYGKFDPICISAYFVLKLV